ncbi:MAG: alkaline phosphatase family protein [Bacteroidota bacterium]|nr:alkaline phosphatase family protein [Bacteroidota bacterium]
MKTLYGSSLLILSGFISLFCCNCTKDVPVSTYQTQHVVVIVVDGARYSETWAEPSRQFIPRRAALLGQGVLCSNFKNTGGTYTNAGHTAMCSGVYQTINNNGLEYPYNPSLFQFWLKNFKRPATEAWVISSKDKLEVLSNCIDPEWKDKYRPMTDCGVNGLGTGYRDDSTTFFKAKNVFTTHHPRLTLINFKEPDASGHAADSLKYLQGIMDTDEYVQQIWQLLQNDDFYKDKTTLIVTNDHGRHTPGHLDGFVSHGDDCEGCRKIEFFALGPDFKKNYISQTPYEQIDMATTIATLLGFQMPSSQGKMMKDIFVY